jgi:hypothetical protein
VGVFVEVSVKVTVWLVTGDEGAKVKTATGAFTTGWGLLEPPPPHRREARMTNKAPTIGTRRSRRMETPWLHLDVWRCGGNADEVLNGKLL